MIFNKNMLQFHNTYAMQVISLEQRQHKEKHKRPWRVEFWIWSNEIKRLTLNQLWYRTERIILFVAKISAANCFREARNFHNNCINVLAVVVFELCIMVFVV